MRGERIGETNNQVSATPKDKPDEIYPGNALTANGLGVRGATENLWEAQMIVQTVTPQKNKDI